MLRPASRVLPRVLMRLLAVLLFGWVLCVALIFYWSTRQATGNADAIVVMGAAQYGGRPSPVLRARLDHALALWKADRAARVILTGGRRPGDLISEAAAGRRYLGRRGVPATRMLLESTGRTSLASVHGAALLLRSEQPPRRPAARLRPSVLLVSDPFHMLRLDILARLHGMTPLPSPTRTSPISARPRLAVEYMLRESIALPIDVLLLGWLTMTDTAEQRLGAP